ncbi:MAG: D-amino acid dehydrogenase [Proteobacteria bacterium]|nr:D-amino acid dehydrogenase [Burkholderiales bacterium]
MKMLVLGAGVIGTTAAWYLSQSGHEVTVVDRQTRAGNETSFANGGQISVSHAEPWANPHAPMKLVKWLARDDAPLLLRPRLDPAQWRWCVQFLIECLPSRTRHNIAQLVRLGLYSRASLQALRAETGIAYDHLQRGILHFYTDAHEFDAAQAPAQVMRDHGCEIEMIDADRCVQIEPALATARDRLVGGSFTPTDESGDAHRFTVELARLGGERGVQFLTGTRILGLTRVGDRIESVRVVDANGSPGTLRADAYVMALGSYSPLMLNKVGIDAPIYPTKGYSVTIPVGAQHTAPQVSLTDDEYKIVFSRLGDRLRCAGTAELNGYDTELNEVRCRAIVDRLFTLFPNAGDRSQVRYWTGLRPSTPSNVPLIGRSRIGNLYLNTGHGTLGWTHACGSGRALADIVSGRAPEVDFAFLGGARPKRNPAPALVNA